MPDSLMAPAPALRRDLGFGDLVAYGLAYIAPMGIFATLGFVWTESHGLIALAYLLGGICMYFTAQSYAVMTEAVPTSGSVYGFARHSLGVLPGFIAGWLILLDYLLIPAFVFASIAVAIDTLLPGADRAVWIVLLMAFTTAVNWFGATVTSRVNIVAVTLQSIVILVFAGATAIAVDGGFGNGALTLRPFHTPGAFAFGSIFTATSLCVMSFLGFDAISTLSEEVKGNDRRMVGRAIIVVLLIAAGFFVLLAWVFGNAMPGLAVDDPAAAYLVLARRAIEPWAATALAWFVVIVIGLSNALPMQVGVARVLFAMGRDRQLPQVLARVHPGHHTPFVALLVSSTVSLAVALALRNHIDELASIVNFGALAGFLMLHVSVLVRGRSALATLVRPPVRPDGRNRRRTCRAERHELARLECRRGLARAGCRVRVRLEGSGTRFGDLDTAPYTAACRARRGHRTQLFDTPRRSGRDQSRCRTTALHSWRSRGRPRAPRSPAQ